MMGLFEYWLNRMMLGMLLSMFCLCPAGSGDHEEGAA